MQNNIGNTLSHIKFLVVHCSDTEFELHKARDIHNLHLNFGWEGIGYHKVIKRNGVVESGRPEYWVGAHVMGHNKYSLAVCLIGKNNFTKKQMHSLKKILLRWKKKYPFANVMGHRDFDNVKKTCPNFNVKDWYQKEILLDAI